MITVVLFCTTFIFIESLAKCFYSKRAQIYSETIICFVLLFIFFGFRGLPVLNDTAHYYRYANTLYSSKEFDELPWFYFDQSGRFEEGFQIFSRIIGHLFDKEPYSLIMVSALIFTISTIYFLRKNTNQIGLSIFILLSSSILFTQYSAIRQSLAIAMSYFLYDAFINKKYIKSIFLGIISYFFHYSAIILLLPFLLSNISFNRRNIIIVVIIAIVTSFNIYQLLILLGYANHRYYDISIARTATPIAQILNTLFTLICLVLYYTIHKRYSLHIYGENKTFISFAFSALIMDICAIPCLILSRYSLYFSQYAVVLLVNSIYAIPQGSDRRIIKVILIITLLLRLITVLSYRNEWFHLIPYSLFNFDLEHQQTDFGY